MIFPMNARCADRICSAGCAVWSSSLDMQPAAPRLVTHQRLTVVAAVTGCNKDIHTYTHNIPHFLQIYWFLLDFIRLYWILYFFLGGDFHRLSIIDY